MRPRILFVSHTADWVGPTNSLLLLMLHLRDRFDVMALLRGLGPFSNALAQESIPFVSFPTLTKSALPAMFRLIQRQRYDLVYGNNTSCSSQNALLAAKLLHVPFVCHIRGMSLRRPARQLAFLRFADATIAVSAACARSVSSFTPRRPPFVVYNGVPLTVATQVHEAARDQLRAAAGLPESAVVLISVSHISPRKGQEYAVRAMPRITADMPSAHLVLLGALDRDPEYSDRIRALIRELGVERHVHPIGFQSNVFPLLHGADVFVHTAVADPHPRAVIEGMAAGLPVVAFDVDGVAESVIDGETGFLVPATDVDRLAEAVLRLTGSPSLRARLGTAGRSRAASQFSAEETARKVGDIIDAVLRARSRPASRVGRSLVAPLPVRK